VSCHVGGQNRASAVARQKERCAALKATSLPEGDMLLLLAHIVKAR